VLSEECAPVFDSEGEGGALSGADEDDGVDGLAGVSPPDVVRESVR